MPSSARIAGAGRRAASGSSSSRRQRRPPGVPERRRVEHDPVVAAPAARLARDERGRVVDEPADRAGRRGPDSSAFRRAQAIAVRAASTWATAAPARAAASVSRPVCANRFSTAGRRRRRRLGSRSPIRVLQPGEVRDVLRVQPEPARGRRSELHRQAGDLHRPGRRRRRRLVAGAPGRPARLRVEPQVGVPPGSSVVPSHASAPARAGRRSAARIARAAGPRRRRAARHRSVRPSARRSGSMRAIMDAR